MKKKTFLVFGFWVLMIFMGMSQNAVAQLEPGDPIVFGVPTVLGSIEGRDGWMAIQMARGEINV
jgi:hypothetical protein